MINKNQIYSWTTTKLNRIIASVSNLSSLVYIDKTFRDQYYTLLVTHNRLLAVNCKPLTATRPPTKPSWSGRLIMSSVNLVPSNIVYFIFHSCLILYFVSTLSCFMSSMRSINMSALICYARNRTRGRILFPTSVNMILFYHIVYI